MKKTIIFTLLASMSSIALAQTTTTGTTKATASLSSSCIFTSTDAVFGTYDPASAVNQQTNQTVDILCTKGTSWTFYTGATDLYLALGSTTVNGYSITTNNQYSSMTLGANRLLYQVQLKNGVWANDLYQDVNLTNAYTGLGNGATQTLTIPYRILKNQYVVPGNYADTATAYIKF